MLFHSESLISCHSHFSSLLQSVIQDKRNHPHYEISLEEMETLHTLSQELFQLQSLENGHQEDSDIVKHYLQQNKHQMLYIEKLEQEQATLLQEMQIMQSNLNSLEKYKAEYNSIQAFRLNSTVAPLQLESRRKHH